MGEKGSYLISSSVIIEKTRTFSRRNSSVNWHGDARIEIKKLLRAFVDLVSPNYPIETSLSGSRLEQNTRFIGKPEQRSAQTLFLARCTFPLLRSLASNRTNRSQEDELTRPLTRSRVARIEIPSAHRSIMFHRMLIFRRGKSRERLGDSRVGRITSDDTKYQEPAVKASRNPKCLRDVRSGRSINIDSRWPVNERERSLGPQDSSRRTNRLFARRRANDVR